MLSIEYVLLSVQRALLDVVTPELRAVLVDISQSKESTVFLYFYHDGEASEELIDLWQCAATEASAALGANFFVEEIIKRLDFPKEIPPCGKYAYLRKEENQLKDGLSHIKLEKQKTSIEPVAYALLSLQRALLGKVVPTLRAVTVDVSDKQKLLCIKFFYEGVINPEIIHSWELAIKEVAVDCGLEYKLDYEIKRIEFPNKMPFCGRLAYERREMIAKRFFGSSGIAF